MDEYKAMETVFGTSLVSAFVGAVMVTVAACGPTYEIATAPEEGTENAVAENGAGLVLGAGGRATPADSDSGQGSPAGSEEAPFPASEPAWPEEESNSGPQPVPTPAVEGFEDDDDDDDDGDDEDPDDEEPDDEDPDEEPDDEEPGCEGEGCNDDEPECLANIAQCLVDADEPEAAECVMVHVDCLNADDYDGDYIACAELADACFDDLDEEVGEVE